MNRIDDVEKYLSNLAPDERKALASLRNRILQTAPGLEERLSRGVPFFYHLGKRAIGFRSSKGHLSLFIMEGNVLKNLRNELMKYDTSSTVIRFAAEKPLPQKLINKLVLARVEEIERNRVNGRQKQ